MRGIGLQARRRRLNLCGGLIETPLLASTLDTLSTVDQLVSRIATIQSA